MVRWLLAAGLAARTGAAALAGMSALAGAAALLAPTGAAAQQWGARAGTTYVDAHFYDQFTSKARAMPTVGAFVMLPVTRRGAVQIEALFMRRGFSTTGLYADGSTTTMAYVDVPVLLRYELTAARVRPVLMAGGYYAKEVRCRTGGGVSALEGTTDCGGRFKWRGRADVGLIGAAAIEFDVAAGWFGLLDARYHHGVRNLHWDPAADGVEARNLSFSAGVGFRPR